MNGKVLWYYGFDSLSTDYFINGSPLLSEYVSCLFTCMLSHCFIPTSFSVSTMVPIPLLLRIVMF